MAPTKSELRRDALNQRRGMPVEEWSARSRLITDHLFQWILATYPPAGSTPAVHGYLARPETREIDTRPLLLDLIRAGYAVGLPKVAPKNRSMQTLRVHDPMRLEPGPYGIPQPCGNDLLPPHALALVIVPSVLLDVSGNRIGYGGGYYDRFLTSTGAITVAPTFESFLVEGPLPTEPTDRPVQWLATETGVSPAVR